MLSPITNTTMPITIQAPVRGIWKLHTPSGHHPYSKDLEALDFTFRTLKPVARLRLFFGLLDVANLPSWGQPVVAPLSGEILRVVQHHDDHTAVNLIRDGIQRKLDARCAGDDPGAYLGNHIIMAASSGAHILFAHLQKSSAQVVAGQTVAAGDMLARVGNSGISLLPHLHFHITNPTADNPDQPLPFVFEQFDALDNRIWQSCRESLPVDQKPFRVSEP